MLQSIPSVAHLMTESGVAFGTSGARGLVTAMTDRVCHGYVTGFLQYMSECDVWTKGGRVALGGDLRPSTPSILSACAQAVRDLGGMPVFCGYVPTPALAYWSFGQSVPSIMVTGSHIPDDRNGIKFYRPDGEILKEDEIGIARQLANPGQSQWSADGAMLNAPDLSEPINVGPQYVARYVEFFGETALRGLRIGIYQHSAVGRDLLVEIFASLGADVVALGRSGMFIPVDTEAVRSEDIALARQWAAAHRLDAIVSTDGDSDRPLLADHTGEWLRGDVLGVLCARALGVDCVVTPVSSNTLVEKCGAFKEVRRTQIGSPYVIAAMDEALKSGDRIVCGYEANGGFLLASDIVSGTKRLSSLPTRDAILPMVAALVAANPGRLVDLLSGLPQCVTFSDRIQDFTPKRRDALMSWLHGADTRARNTMLEREFGSIAGSVLSDVNLVDGVRMSFSNSRVIHLRGSGNAPELRCYAEAETAASAASLCRKALMLVSEKFPA